MKAEIITIGTEILIGQTIDTNSAWIGQQLQSLGIEVYRRTSIADKQELMLSAFEKAKDEVDIIITTGGLGPTNDDITKHTIAKWLNKSLTIHRESEERIRQFYQQRGREVNDLALSQALIVEGSQGYVNSVGAAPLMKIDLNDHKLMFCLPGVPYEMKALFENYILPILKDLSGNHIEHFYLNTVGITETKLALLLKNFENQLPENIQLAYLPSVRMLKLRLSLICKHEEAEKWKPIFKERSQELETLCGDFVFSYQDSLEKVIFQHLKERKMSISISESCTGGNLAGSLVKLDGASEVFYGGIVAYSNEIKTNVLGVNPETIKTYGAVSEETAIEMASQIRKLCNTDIGIATTGIAGPGGATPTKPVGTICIALVTNDLKFVKRFQLGENPREMFIERAIVNAWDILRKYLTNKKL